MSKSRVVRIKSHFFAHLSAEVLDMPGMSESDLLNNILYSRYFGAKTSVPSAFPSPAENNKKTPKKPLKKFSNLLKIAVYIPDQKTTWVTEVKRKDEFFIKYIERLEVIGTNTVNELAAEENIPRAIVRVDEEDEDMLHQAAQAAEQLFYMERSLREASEETAAYFRAHRTKHKPYVSNRIEEIREERYCS